MVVCLTSARFNMKADILRQGYEDNSVFDPTDEAGEWVNQQDPRDRKVSFGSISHKMTQHAEPADEEGGYVSSFILLEALYTVTNPTVVFDGFTYP